MDVASSAYDRFHSDHLPPWRLPPGGKPAETDEIIGGPLITNADVQMVTRRAPPRGSLVASRPLYIHCPPALPRPPPSPSPPHPNTSPPLVAPGLQVGHPTFAPLPPVPAPRPCPFSTPFLPPRHSLFRARAPRALSSSPPCILSSPLPGLCSTVLPGLVEGHRACHCPHTRAQHRRALFSIPLTSLACELAPFLSGCCCHCRARLGLFLCRCTRMLDGQGG